jgi:hypothetical protein
MGFSIVQALVGAVILGFLAVAFSQLISNALKGQKNVQNAVDFDILKSNLNLTLNPRSCVGNFFIGTGSTPITVTLPAGKNWGNLPPNTNLFATPQSVVVIKQGSSEQGSSEIVKLNQVIGGNLKITKLEFIVANYAGNQSYTDPVTSVTTNYKAFTAQLQMQATKQGPAIGALSYDTQLGVRLLFTALGGSTGTTGTLTACGLPDPTSSSAFDPLAAWKTASGFENFPTYVLCRSTYTPGGGMVAILTGFTATHALYDGGADTYALRQFYAKSSGINSEGPGWHAPAPSYPSHDCPDTLFLDGRLIDGP